MAAPVKNLIDATGLSKRCPDEFMSISPTYTAKMLNSFNIMEISATFGMLVSTQILGNITTIPLPSVSITQKEAVLATIKTFPSMYKERTGTRPSEGQLFPRPFK